MKEASVSTKLREALASLGAVAWKVSDRFHASRPDLLVLHNIVTIYVEVKVHPNNVTPAQQHTLDDLANHGAPCYVGTYFPNSKTFIFADMRGTSSMPFFKMKEAAAWLLKLHS